MDRKSQTLSGPHPTPTGHKGLVPSFQTAPIFNLSSTKASRLLAGGALNPASMYIGIYKGAWFVIMPNMLVTLKREGNDNDV